MLLEIVASGEGLAELSGQLREGARIRATGKLRALPLAVRRRLGIEVIADRVELDRSSGPGGNRGR
ncbi:MAG: OB-fold nucleic acid binding domain-containing protein [Candidatus Binataceae bacterium]